VIRLISAGLLLVGAFAASAAAFRWLLGPAAPVPGGLGTAGRVITGLVQVACLAAVVVVVAATLRRRRFRLLAGLAAGAVAAAGLTAGILAILGAERPATLTANQARGSWLASTAFPAPALLAAAVAVVVAAAPWLSRPWRRAAWLALLLAAAARLLAGAVLPAELILALAAGVTAGAAVLVTLGVPDRRIGPAGIAAALRHAGVPVESVRPAEVEARGSRPFAAVTADGRRLFVKALGSDQRDADLLYRAYRAVRLRNVGDTRPAASLLHAVEHQALVGLMAERAGVSAPGVDRVVRAGDTVLLVMPWAGGCSLDRLPAGQIGDDLLARLWAEVDKLHRAGIAHRSLRTANVMADPPAGPRSSTSASPSSMPRRGRWTWTWPNCWPRWPCWPARTGSSPPRSVSSAPGGWARRCRCCSRWPCPRPPAARSRGTTACSPGPGRGRHRQRPPVA
jgi:undecaprenyl-diphosphatase